MTSVANPETINEPSSGPICVSQRHGFPELVDEPSTTRALADRTGDHHPLSRQHFSADVVVRPQLLCIQGQPARAARVHRPQKLRRRAHRSRHLGTVPQYRDHRRRQRRAAVDRRLPAGVAVRAGISAAALSSDARPFADDVVAQRRRGFLQTLLRPDARLYQPVHFAVHARHLCHSVDPGAGDDRDRRRRRLDVVAVRDAAGAGRPGERPEISLRGR